MRTRSLRKSAVIFRRDQQSRRWGEGFLSCQDWEKPCKHARLICRGYVSFFELLLGYPAFSGSRGKKSYWKANITAGILLVHTARTRQSPSLRKGTEQPRRCFHTDTHKNRLLEHMEKWTSIQRRNPFNHFQSCRSVYKSLKLPRPQSKQPKKDFCVLHFWKTKTYFRSLTCYQQTKAGSNSGILANKYNQKTHVCKHL